MRRTGFVLVTCLILSACDRSAEPYLEVMRAQAAAQREVLEILRTVQDEDTMKAARKKLLERWSHMESIKEKATKMTPPTREVTERLQQELPAIEKTLQGIAEEVRRIGTMPGGKDFLQLRVQDASP